MHNEFQSKQISRRNIIGDVTGGRTDTGGGGGGSTTTTVNLAVYCMYVTLTNYDLNGTETVDGESPSNGDRILVANQTDPKQNGIYIYNSSGAWARATDLVPALQITILGGTKQGTIWVVETPTFSIGTDNISIIESAISRKDNSFAGFDAVTSLMTSDIALFQVSSNEIQSATVQDIMDTYGARGLWDSVTIKTADTRVTGTTFGDVAEITVDLDADSEYEFEFISLSTSKVSTVTNGTYLQWIYSGTLEYGEYFTNRNYSDEGTVINSWVNSSVYAKTSGSDTTITPGVDITNGLIKTTTSGTLKAQIKGWNGSNIATLHAGSVFKVKKLDTFTNFQPSSGEANTGVNVGGEKEVYKSMSGTALQFRTLKEGTNVTLTQNTNDITIDVAGGGFYDGYVVVTADESVTGNTLTDSTYLTVSLDATSTYLIRAVLYLDDNATSNQPKGQFAYTGTIDYSGIRKKDGNYVVDITTSNTISGDFNKAKGWLNEITGMITTTTSGTFKLQFANQFGTGTVYLRKGSIMYYKKVL